MRRNAPAGSFRAPFLLRIYMPEPVEERGSYPLSLALFADGFELEMTKPVTILVGENGSGKSTLLEAIATHCGFNLSSGGRDHIYDQRNDVRPLVDALRFSWRVKVNEGFFMRAESFTNFSAYIDGIAAEDPTFDYAAYGGRSLDEQSHGEAFFSVFANRFGRRGIYVFDEPEAALSPLRQFAFLRLLHEFAQQGSHQIIMATHSPVLMALPDAELLMIDDGQIVERNFTATDHFVLLKRFFSDPDGTVKRILADDDG